MRALLATYAGAGHLLPMVRLRDRLRGAGHQAEVLAAGDGADRRYRSVPPPPPGRFEEHVAAYGQVVFGPALAEEVRDVAAASGADVAVVDALVPAALCGAHASGAIAVTLLNLPYGRLRRELLAGSGWWGGQRARLDATRAALGLAPYRSALESWEDAPLMLLLGLPELEDEGMVVPPHLRFVGPCLPPVPEPATTEARVVVALSSSDMGHVAALQAVLDDLATLDLGVVATTAGVVDRAALHVPPGCELHDWLPMPEALAGAAAVVTHGGHGTVMAALAAGVPLVCVPLGRDQPFTAARIERLGAGRVASPGSAAAAVAEVLADPAHREAAGRLRDRITSLSTAAVEALEGLEALSPPGPHGRR